MDGDEPKSSFWDVLIEFIKNIKELAMHVWDSETTPLIGKANFVILVTFCLVIALMMLMQITVPKPAYNILTVGIMSCMMSSLSLEKLIERELKP
jgi:hypothetical protein